jgi:ADP-heptose:LPS heptosyltransferase
METLLKAMRCRPWKVFAGDLNLVQLAAVIQHSAMHLCGDTGTLHLALMTGTPAVSWFWPNPGMKAWAPAGEHYQTLVGTTSPEVRHLGGIATGALVEAVATVLESRLSPPTFP